ncbi:hypothetical protein ACQ86G_18990 [Roseateles chitinivorans]|uniref:hypothetical protein n=1 Tax=Roseateles chitinivorans TaxID=2917965 RepID=UPI003D677111
MPLLEMDMQVLGHRQLRGETVSLTKETCINGIEHCHFVDCQIVLDPKGLPAIGRVGARFWFAHCSFEGCTFVVKGKLKGLDLTHHVRMVDCTLSGGPLLEPRFGTAPIFADVVPPQERPLTNCDFTGADLRDAVFFRAAWRELRIPGWPYISVLSQDADSVFTQPSPRLPARTVLADAVKDFEWESDAMERSITALVFGVGLRSNERQIQVCHAETVAQRADATVEQVRAALDRFAHPAIRY